MEKTYDTLSKAIYDLQKQGYTEDFNLHAEGIESKSAQATWKAEQLEVVKYFRFEGMTNPSDSSILYVIETNDGKKGLLVDSYSAETSSVPEEMIEKLKIQH
ncbi:MAG: phosphoribosylpyrophosphate synthetase [Flavobacteriaceae bacterium]|nr:phosphoribosylpyrophosphate synthetase [Flavobacteriaceae bacterium]|tara:strand:+ start:1223 stop:1528 length:306 start_codon:yes stop_codon:yes gene_type:complete